QDKRDLLCKPDTFERYLFYASFIFLAQIGLLLGGLDIFDYTISKQILLNPRYTIQFYALAAAINGVFVFKTYRDLGLTAADKTTLQKLMLTSLAIFLVWISCQAASVVRDNWKKYNNRYIYDAIIVFEEHMRNYPSDCRYLSEVDQASYYW